MELVRWICGRDENNRVAGRQMQGPIDVREFVGASSGSSPVNIRSRSLGRREVYQDRRDPLTLRSR